MLGNWSQLCLHICPCFCLPFVQVWIPQKQCLFKPQVPSLKTKSLFFSRIFLSLSHSLFFSKWIHISFLWATLTGSLSWRRTPLVYLTPFLMLVSHRTDMLRRSKSLMSPLSYPAHTQRSCSLKAWPVMKKPKEVQRSLYEIRKRPHWEYNQNASKIWHKNYINIIILN